MSQLLQHTRDYTARCVHGWKNVGLKKFVVF